MYGVINGSLENLKYASAEISLIQEPQPNLGITSATPDSLRRAYWFKSYAKEFARIEAGFGYSSH